MKLDMQYVSGVQVFVKPTGNERAAQRRPLPGWQRSRLHPCAIAPWRLPDRGTGGSRDDDHRQLSYSPLGIRLEVYGAERRPSNSKPYCLAIT